MRKGLERGVVASLLATCAICAVAADNGSGGNILPPYEFQFPGSLSGWTCHNLNDDNEWWTFDQWNGTGGMLCGSGETDKGHQSTGVDDWAISPGVLLEGGKIYMLSFAAKAPLVGYDYAKEANSYKSLEIRYGAGTTPAAMTESVMSFGEAKGARMEAYIMPDETGIYHIGFHMKETLPTLLCIYDIQIGSAMERDIPGKGNIAVLPDSEGSLAAAISMTLPTTDCNGMPLSGITSAELLRDGEKIYEIENAEP